ncbi:MAG: hypothetical protein HY318_15265 [Armatimonadetes bacterium]|nr:hypothetical protein [Armatimonadota bacterium]
MQQGSRPPAGHKVNQRGRPTRNESPRLPSAIRFAFCLFVALLCMRIGLAFSYYDQTADEVRSKERELRDLRAEQRRLDQKLRYLDTPEGREEEALKQGWIPRGHRMLVLPAGKSKTSATGPWGKDTPSGGVVHNMAQKTLEILRHCQEELTRQSKSPNEKE